MSVSRAHRSGGDAGGREGPLRPRGHRIRAGAGLAWVALVLSACATAPDPTQPRTDSAPATADGPPVVAALSGFTEPPPEPPAPGTQRRTALLVGIDDAGGAPPLRGAVADVETLRSALLAYGFPPDQIITLVAGQATRDRILTAIQDLAARTAPAGRAVFAFAGHTRRTGGTNHVLAADGRTIPASQLARSLSALRAPAWIALPTCYAAGFALPGIIGPGRVATFASPADRPSYESLAFGRSFLFEYMVARAMLAGRASESVEQAFRFAREGLERDFPEHLPLMEDGHPGPFVLGAAIPPSPPPDEGASAAPVPTPTPSPDGDEPGSDADDEPGAALVCGTKLPVEGCRRG